MKQNITQTRLDKQALNDAIENEESVEIIVPERKLKSVLETIQQLDIELEPTNASTRDLIENTLTGAAIGAGLGAIASVLRIVPGPIGWIAAAGGLLGGATGFFCTKYRIRIEHRGHSGGESVFRLSMNPAN